MVSTTATTHQNPKLFLPGWYHPPAVVTNPTPARTCLRSAVCFFVCGSGRQADPAGQNRQRQLLPADAGGHRAGIAGPRRAAGGAAWTIAAGLPLTSYGREKPAFRKYLLRNAGQATEFGYEGKTYCVTIEDVLLFPQGFTALMTQPDLLTDEPSMLLLDIGGWTMDLMRIDNGRPIIGTCHSLELGMIRCIDEVRERVRQNTGLSLTDAQIEQVLAGRPCSLEETVCSLIREQGRLYTERLLSAVLEAGFELPRVAGRHDGRRRVGGQPPHPPHRRPVLHGHAAGRPCQRARLRARCGHSFGRC